MKKKLSALVVSLAIIAVCASLVVGATFALFTSESNVNVSVSTGKVSVEAAVTGLETYSLGVAQADGAFANNGEATVVGREVSLSNIAPGDKAVLQVEVSNNSNIAYKQRMALSCSDPEGIASQLLVGISYDGVNYTYYESLATDWEDGSSDPVSTLYLSIELPEYVTSKWAGKSCSLGLLFQAVQGNATPSADVVAKQLTVVDSVDNLDDAIAAAADGDVIVLRGVSYDSVSIAYNEAKEISLRGAKIGVLTVDAPNGRVNVYNNVGTLNGDAVAMNSLHVYGEVDNIIMKQGRLVIEKTAEVVSVVLEPAADQSVQIEKDQDAVVANVEISTNAQGTIAMDAATADKCDTYAIASTAMDLYYGLKAGGIVVVEEDIVYCLSNERFNFVKNATIDLGDNTLTANPMFIYENAEKIVFKNGTIAHIQQNSNQQGDFAITSYADLELDNVIVQAQDMISAYGIAEYNAVELAAFHDLVATISNCEIAGAIQAENIGDAHNSLTLNNTDVTSHGSFVVISSGANTTVVINGGSYINNGNAETNNGMPTTAVLQAQYGATLIVNGGTFIAGDALTLAHVGNDGGSIIINAGTFDRDVSEFVAETSQIEEVDGLWIVTVK